MEHCILGRTGVKVSRLCPGTMSFGSIADERASADIYAQGRAEEILGKLIKDCRDEIVLTSKVSGKTGEDLNACGLSRRHIMRAVSEFETLENGSTGSLFCTLL